MKAILFGLMLTFLCLSINAEEQTQQKSLDTLLDNIQRRDEHTSSVSLEEQIRRLRNQLIDIKVERDLLEERNEYLHQQIQRLRNRDSSRVFPETECISVEKAEEQRLVQHVVYSFVLYRLGEFMDSVIPEEDVEAHRRAQKIMDGAKADLKLLGFDTSNPDEFPSLEELLEQLDIAHEVHGNRLSTN